VGITVIPAYRVVSTLARKARDLPFEQAVDSMEQGLREYVRSLLSMLHPSIMELGERSAVTQLGDPDPSALLDALMKLDEGDPKTIVEQSLEQCAAALPRPDLNARVFLFPGDGDSKVLVRQMNGVLGFSLGSQAMAVFLWPAEGWQRWLSYTVSHEYVHLVRNMLFPRSPAGGRLMYIKTQTPETLLDAMVAEGLADHFAIGLHPEMRPPWTSALTEEQMRHLWPRVRRRLGAADMTEIRRVLFGDNDRIPMWTGYTLGHHIVEGYLRRHPGARPAGLVGVSGKVIFEEAGLTL
jgi:uncharacterized protein YjaZ